jgi:hypothetical protein
MGGGSEGETMDTVSSVELALSELSERSWEGGGCFGWVNVELNWAWSVSSESTSANDL